ncbi:MAG: dethiobiotin synthase [Methyloligellaceae bacterium]
MSIFVTGTDTEVGKTVACAWLAVHFDMAYWKPVQCGLEDGTDVQTVQDLTEHGSGYFFPSAHILEDPLSPHEAARRAGIRIDLGDFQLPRSGRPLIVEGAGGVLVPLNETELMTDLMAALDLPVVLVCRSTLGTINHTLMSLRTLRGAGLRVNGAVLVGPKLPHNREAIEHYGKVSIIGEIPPLDELTRQSLLAIEPEINIQDC